MNIRTAASAVLIAVSFLNLGHSNRSLSILPSRQHDEVVFLEQRLMPVRDALIRAGYENGGTVGYLSPGIISSGKASPGEEKFWAESRYGMIPWSLVLGAMDAPYVVVEFWGAQAGFDIPAGFSKVYDSQDGLILLMRTSS